MWLKEEMRKYIVWGTSENTVYQCVECKLLKQDLRKTYSTKCLKPMTSALTQKKIKVESKRKVSRRKDRIKIRGKIKQKTEKKEN